MNMKKFITLIFSNNKRTENDVENCAQPQSDQIYTTCIFLVFLHIVSYFLFTYLMILSGIYIFFLSFLFVCSVDKVILDVHLLYTSDSYCGFLLLCQA